MGHASEGGIKNEVRLDTLTTKKKQCSYTALKKRREEEKAEGGSIP